MAITKLDVLKRGFAIIDIGSYKTVETIKDGYALFTNFIICTII